MTQNEFFNKLSTVYNDYEDNKHKIVRGSTEIRREKAKEEIFAIVDDYFGGKA